MRLKGLPRFAWSSMAAVSVLVLGCLSLVAQTKPPAPQRAARPPVPVPAGTPIKVLFLGTDEETPHNPSKMFPLLAAPLARRGIQLTYGGTAIEILDPAKLGYYDAVMVDRNARDRSRPHHPLTSDNVSSVMGSAKCRSI